MSRRHTGNRGDGRRRPGFDPDAGLAELREIPSGLSVGEDVPSGSPGPEDIASFLEMRHIMRDKFCPQLTPREERYSRIRWSLDGGGDWRSNAECGVEMDCSTTRCWQIEGKILRKARRWLTCRPRFGPRFQAGVSLLEGELSGYRTTTRLGPAEPSEEETIALAQHEQRRIPGLPKAWVINVFRAFLRGFVHMVLLSSRKCYTHESAGEVHSQAVGACLVASEPMIVVLGYRSQHTLSFRELKRHQNDAARALVATCQAQARDRRSRPRG